MSIATLGYALLAVLARGPCSGYDLGRTLRQHVAPFWQAAHSHIYPELARLLERGLVSVERVEQTDRPDKKVYAVTDAGRAAMAAWLAQPTDVRVPRDELVLKAYALWLGDRQDQLRLYREHEARHRDRLRHYEAIGSDMRRRWPDAVRNWRSPAFASYATVQRGIYYEREYAAWCRWLIDQLEAADG